MRHVAVRRIHTALEAFRAMESEFISAQVAVGAVWTPAVNAILAEITVGTPVHTVVLPFAAALAGAAGDSREVTGGQQFCHIVLVPFE